jgi:hypothetical protein
MFFAAVGALIGLAACANMRPMAADPDSTTAAARHRVGNP